MENLARILIEEHPVNFILSKFHAHPTEERNKKTKPIRIGLGFNFSVDSIWKLLNWLSVIAAFAFVAAAVAIAVSRTTWWSIMAFSIVAFYVIGFACLDDNRWASFDRPSGDNDWSWDNYWSWGNHNRRWLCNDRWCNWSANRCLCLLYTSPSPRD